MVPKTYTCVQRSKHIPTLGLAVGLFFLFVPLFGQYTDKRSNGRVEALPAPAPSIAELMTSSSSEAAGAVAKVLSLDELCPPALEKALPLANLEQLAVQSEGMNYSLRTWSEILVAGVTGKPRFQRRDPVVMALSMVYRQSDWLNEPVIPVESPAVAKLLGLDPNVRHRVSAASLMRQPAARRYVMGYLMNRDAALQGLDSATQKGVKKLAFRLANLLNAPQEFRIIPLGTSDGAMASPFVIEDPTLDAEAASVLMRARVPDALVSAAVALHGALREAFTTGATSEDLSSLVEKFVQQAEKVSGYPPAWKIRLDRWYTTFHPFQKAAQIYWLAVAAFVIVVVLMRGARARAASLEHNAAAAPGGGIEVLAGAPVPQDARDELSTIPKWGRWCYHLGLASLVLAAVAMLSGLVARFLLGGRMPVSNMYESITFTMASFAVLGVAFETSYRRAWIGLLVALAGTFCMTMANSMPLHLRKVEPLVAVLNSVWLNYHVTSLLLSYSAFLLSFLFALGYFAKDLAPRAFAFLPSTDALEQLCYRSVLVGWPLLTLGIILGAVWANTAWGRYWSWDPKETWAFITWLSYTIYLHLRMVRGWRGRWSVAASMIGFLMVLITYFGVSYLPGLAGGLHTYAEPISR